MRVFLFWLAGTILLYVQVFSAHRLAIFGITPNLLLPFYIYTGTRLNDKPALIIVFLISLVHDLMTPLILGVGVFLSLLVTWLVNRYHKSLNKDRIQSVLLAVGAIVLLHQIPYFLVHFARYGHKEIGYWLIFVHMPVQLIWTILIILMLHLLSRLRISFRGYDI